MSDDARRGAGMAAAAAPAMPQEELAARWDAALRACGRAEPGPIAGEVLDRLVERWTEPHRAYHDLEHLGEVLVALDRLTAPAAADPVAVLAAFFHDAVYRGRPDDEQDSADLAAGELGRLLPAPAVDAVVGAVLATRHGAGTTAAGAETGPSGADALLVDADLAVLAAPADRYARYVAGVRAEYHRVDDEAFRRGRAAVLRGFTDRAWVYGTVRGRELWEAASRVNLAHELAALADPASRPGLL